jgi:hypothetical protein
MRLKAILGAALVGVSVLAGCQDLDVVNTNQPDRVRAITNPADVEALVIGSWPLYWGRTITSSSSYNAMPTIADVMTATYANNASLKLSSEPRVAFQNSQSAEEHGIARYQWYDWYEMLSNANDALLAIENGIEIIDEATGRNTTTQTMALAKLFQGASLGYISCLFDQVVVATEDTDIEDPDALALKPYTEGVEQALASLDEAIDLAGQVGEWYNGGNWATLWEGIPEVTSDMVIRVAHSHAARLEVLSARGPQESAGLNWTRINNHINAGIQEDWVHGVSQQGQRASYWYRYRNTTTTFVGRIDNYFVGEADASGAFQAYMNTPITERERFQVTTKDRRVTGATPDSDGKYFGYRENTYGFRPERGLYHFSYYQAERYPEVNSSYRVGSVPLYTVDEMRLYRALGAFRTGNNALAAELANVTRVANGELPPLTAAGVPESPDCVPKTKSGACGSLEQAIQWEFLMELHLLNCLYPYLTRRHFGTLTPGTFTQLPIPARELETLGLDIYTFGGPNGESSAGDWRW